MADKKVIILCVLSVLAIGSLSYGIFASSKGGSGRGLEGGTSIDTTMLVNLENLDFRPRRALKSGSDSWNRDPFVLKEEESSGIVLNGILFDELMPAAIINSQVVKVGDTVGENIVVEITPDKVILKNSSNTTELRLE